MPDYLPRFYSLYMKTNVLPMNLFCIGKQYWSLLNCDGNEMFKNPSLFKTQQSSCVSLLSMTEDSTSAESTFQEFHSKMQSFYDQLGLKYRIVYKSAEKLALAESLRLEVQMWSPLNQTYIKGGRERPQSFN